eukprot:15335063-Ditylum_brightwellii.AAC.4
MFIQLITIHPSFCKECNRISGKENDLRWTMPSKAETPTRASYRPELGITPVLSPFDSAYCQWLSGMLRWMVELGRINMCLEASLMSSHLDMPREGHMAEVLGIFAHIRKCHSTELVFDPSDHVVDELAFEQ